MRCTEVRELLGNYLDAELTESMMQRIERHLLRCPHCAYEAHSIAQARDLLRQWVDTPMVNEALGERVLRRVLQRFPHLRQQPPDEQTPSLPLLPEDNREH